MTREQFLAELTRRGYPRERVFLTPGPDERRNPEGGGIVVEAPSPRTDGQWRTYKLERGVRDEARFGSEDEVYEFVLDTHFPPRPGTAGPATRAAFLDEAEHRGARRSWFAFRDRPDDPPGREGQFVIETFGGRVRTYRMDGGPRDEQDLAGEDAAWRAVLASLPGGGR